MRWEKKMVIQLFSREISSSDLPILVERVSTDHPALSLDSPPSPLRSQVKLTVKQNLQTERNKTKKKKCSFVPSFLSSPVHYFRFAIKYWFA